MPPTTPPNSTSRVVRSGEMNSLPALAGQPEPKTPERNRTATHPPVGGTPLSEGTSMMQKLLSQTPQPQKCGIAKYERYIAQDFARNRVFVDIDVFMTHVLHVPADWEVSWARTIRRIKRDPAFHTAHWSFTRECGTQGVPEWRLYKPLVDMTNIIVGLSSDVLPAKSGTRVHYLRNDPHGILHGLMNDLKPDIVAVHDDFFPRLRSEEREQSRITKTKLTWAQPLQLLEVKPFDCALVDGSCMPRLKMNGRDPQEDHAPPHRPSRYPKKKGTPATTTAPAVQQAAPGSSSRKRPADESQDLSRKSQKLREKSTPAGGAAESSAVEPQVDETNCQKTVHLQVGRYLLEKFSVPGFRSHATVGLVDRDRIQFYHANRSVILVSSAINFSAADRTGGLDKFIAIAIAFNRLTLRDNGVLHNLHDGILHNPHDGTPHKSSNCIHRNPCDGRLFGDNEKLPAIPASSLKHGTVEIQGTHKLVFGGNEETGEFTLTLGDVIANEPSLTGRSTTVLCAESSKWKGRDLVVKISWPSSDRIAEHKFLNRAKEVAKSAPEHNWALQHLPDVLFAQDVIFTPDSTYEKVASLFENAEFVDEGYTYERRTLRIIIQERLYPLKALTSEKDVAQVLLDVACVHRWLYDKPGILHRDLSPTNIMCRFTEEGVCGVLTDYDLSSWVSTLNTDYTKTSQQRTGTPPYMAYGLLDGTDAVHLYRHDVESIFYIMLILAAHYEIRAPTKEEDGGLRVREGILRFQPWFELLDYDTLGEKKMGFFLSLKPFELSPSFKNFRSWLSGLRKVFNHGFMAKNRNRSSQVFGEQAEESSDEDMTPYDDETLGGHLTYSVFIRSARNLTGRLGELAIRYEPPS